jgi:hypothetical protein
VTESDSGDDARKQCHEVPRNIPQKRGIMKPSANLLPSSNKFAKIAASSQASAPTRQTLLTKMKSARAETGNDLPEFFRKAGVALSASRQSSATAEKTVCDLFKFLLNPEIKGDSRVVGYLQKIYNKVTYATDATRKESKMPPLDDLAAIARSTRRMCHLDTVNVEHALHLCKHIAQYQTDGENSNITSFASRMTLQLLELVKVPQQAAIRAELQARGPVAVQEIETSYTTLMEGTRSSGSYTIVHDELFVAFMTQVVNTLAKSDVDVAGRELVLRCIKSKVGFAHCGDAVGHLLRIAGNVSWDDCVASVIFSQEDVAEAPRYPLPARTVPRPLVLDYDENESMSVSAASESVHVFDYLEELSHARLDSSDFFGLLDYLSEVPLYFERFPTDLHPVKVVATYLHRVLWKEKGYTD